MKYGLTIGALVMVCQTSMIWSASSSGDQAGDVSRVGTEVTAVTNFADVRTSLGSLATSQQLAVVSKLDELIALQQAQLKETKDHNTLMTLSVKAQTLSALVAVAQIGKASDGSNAAIRQIRDELTLTATRIMWPRQA